MLILLKPNGLCDCSCVFPIELSVNVEERNDVRTSTHSPCEHRFITSRHWKEKF